MSEQLERTLTEQLERASEETPKPKQPAPKRKRNRRPVAKPVPPVPSEFAGLTGKDCCSACCIDKCVISGIAVCAHPVTIGLQSALASNPEIVARFDRAKKALAHYFIDKRQP